MKILNVSYSQARQMTVWEFNHRVRGVRDRRLDQLRDLRWMVGQLLSPHVKKGQTLRVSDLLPLPDDVPLPKMSSDRIKADVDMKQRIFFKHRRN